MISALFFIISFLLPVLGLFWHVWPGDVLGPWVSTTGWVEIMLWIDNELIVRDCFFGPWVSSFRTLVQPEHQGGRKTHVCLFLALLELRSSFAGPLSQPFLSCSCKWSSSRVSYACLLCLRVRFLVLSHLQALLLHKSESWQESFWQPCQCSLSHSSWPEQWALLGQQTPWCRSPEKEAQSASSSTSRGTQPRNYLFSGFQHLQNNPELVFYY